MESPSFAPSLSPTPCDGNLTFCGCQAGWSSTGDLRGENVDLTICSVNVAAVQILYALAALSWGFNFFFAILLIYSKTRIGKFNKKYLQNWHTDNSFTLVLMAVGSVLFVLCSVLKASNADTHSIGQSVAESITFGLAYMAFGAIVLLFVLLIVNIVYVRFFLHA